MDKKHEKKKSQKIWWMIKMDEMCKKLIKNQEIIEKVDLQYEKNNGKWSKNFIKMDKQYKKPIKNQWIKKISEICA